MQNRDDKIKNDKINKNAIKKGLSKTAGAIVGGIEGLIVGSFSNAGNYIFNITNNVNHWNQSHQRALQFDIKDGICAAGSLTGSGAIIGAIQGAIIGAKGGLKAGSTAGRTLFNYLPSQQSVLKKIKHLQKWHTEDVAIQEVRENLKISLKKYPKHYHSFIVDGTLLTSNEKVMNKEYQQVIIAIITMLNCGELESNKFQANQFQVLFPDLMLLIAANTANSNIISKDLATEVANKAYFYAKSENEVDIDKLIQKISIKVYNELELGLDKFNVPNPRVWQPI